MVLQFYTGRQGLSAAPAEWEVELEEVAEGMDPQIWEAIPQQAGISHEGRVNLLPLARGRIPGDAFPQGEAWRCWDQPITVIPPLFVPPGAHSQPSPALNLSVIQVSLSDRNAVKMSAVRLPCPPVTRASG